MTLWKVVLEEGASWWKAVCDLVDDNHILRHLWIHCQDAEQSQRQIIDLHRRLGMNGNAPLDIVYFWVETGAQENELTEYL